MPLGASAKSKKVRDVSNGREGSQKNVHMTFLVDKIDLCRFPLSCSNFCIRRGETTGCIKKLIEPLKFILDYLQAVECCRQNTNI